MNENDYESEKRYKCEVCSNDFYFWKSNLTEEACCMIMLTHVMMLW